MRHIDTAPMRTLALAAAVLLGLTLGCTARRQAPPPTSSGAATTTPAEAPAPTAVTAPDLARALTADGAVALRTIYFSTGKAELTTAAQPTLEQILILLQSNPQLALEIGVHSDSSGSSAYNQRLSAERAGAITTWLVGHGIAGARLTPVGYGESMPLDCGDTAECRAQCRRVELTVRDGG